MTVNTTMTDDGYSIYDPDYFSDNTFRSERFITEQLGMVDTTNDTVFVVHFYPTYTDSTETSKVKTIIPWKFDFAWKN
jgi:lipoate-protein ligase B